MNENQTIDRRIARTRLAIRGALVALIKEKGFEAVMVRGIVLRANITSRVQCAPPGLGSVSLKVGFLQSGGTGAKPFESLAGSLWLAWRSSTSPIPSMEFLSGCYTNK